MDPFSAANIDTIAATLTALAPTAPKTRCIIKAATRGAAATSRAGRTRKYARLVSRYMTITATVPAISARGRLRCG